MSSNDACHSPLREPQFHETIKSVEQTHEVGVCALFVVARDLHTGNGARTHRMCQLLVESHWQKKYEAKDQELEDLKAEMTRVVEIMTVMGRLSSNGEVWSLAEIKKKVSPKI